MISIVDVPVREDLLARLAADASGHEPERLGVVFPNQRAIHHFGVALAQRTGKAQRPPFMAPLERFVAELAGFAEEDLLPETDAVHLLWRVVKEEAPGVLEEARREFAAFYPWGRAFLKALDELDREMVSTSEVERIRGLEAFDALGPQAKAFYGALPAVRKGFHRELAKLGRCTKGTVYPRALERVKRGEAKVPEALFFGGFFAFTKGDRELLRVLGRSSAVTLYRHHDGRSWEAFKTVERELVPDHVPPSYGPPALDLRLHAAPSAHGEVLAAARLLGEAGSDPGRTAVVLPDPERLVPLLWEAVGGLGVDYNITMGYPLVRTPLYALLDQVLRVAETARSGKVRVLEYLRLLFHPYVKGFGGADSGTRFIVHAVEEVLRRRGAAYVFLRELEGDAAILEKASATAFGARGWSWLPRPAGSASASCTRSSSRPPRRRGTWAPWRGPSSTSSSKWGAGATPTTTPSSTPSSRRPPTPSTGSPPSRRRGSRRGRAARSSASCATTSRKRARPSRASPSRACRSSGYWRPGRWPSNA